MDRVRSALRAYSLLTDLPGQVLTMLDANVMHFEAGTLVTMLYATISPDGATIRLSSAGHPFPLLAMPGRPTAPIEIPIDAILGADTRRRTRQTKLITLPTDALLVPYTDGLVERRNEVIDTGIENLAGTIEPSGPETVCDAIMSSINLEQATDDVAVLALRVKRLD